MVIKQLEPTIKTVNKVSVTYWQGDLLKSWRYISEPISVLVQGCNCMNVMGAGISGPFDKEFAASHWDRLDPRTPAEKLGGINCFPYPMEIDPKKNEIGYWIWIVNAYTQFAPGRDARVLAVTEAFEEIDERFKGRHIAMPAIGCGIGGLSWDKQVEPLMFHVFKKVKSIHVFFLNKKEYEHHTKRKHEI